MVIKYSQSILRSRFLFRIIVLVLSLWVFKIYWQTESQATIFTILLGVSGSLSAWALVELIDFFIETCQKYWNQRNQFFLMLNGYWSELVVLLKGNPEDISYEVVKDVIDRMYTEVAKYPLEAEIYTLSKEWEQCANYIMRLQETFWGNYFHGSGYKYTLSENKKHLYNILVKEEKISDNPRRYKSNIDEIVKRAEEFSRIEINFEKLKENDAIRYHSRGRISD